MGSAPLACTVRDCGLFLERAGTTYRCARGHTYDVARSGYVTLLQPQDRKSLAAGDREEAVTARARLLAAGVGRALLTGVADRAARLLRPNDVVVDLGSGSGDALAAIAARVAIIGVGVDLSAAAAAHAARRFPALTWVVANADRRLPLLDRSVDLLLSVHGRRNPGDSARVLTRAGHLLVVVPAADDLIELRTMVQGAGVARTRSDAVCAEHRGLFRLVDRFELREQHHLAHDALVDLLRGTYRGGRRTAAERVAALDSLDVTLASHALVFEKGS